MFYYYFIFINYLAFRSNNFVILFIYGEIKLTYLPEKLDSGCIVWTPELWTPGLWNPGRLDIGHLDPGRLGAWTLEVWTLGLWTIGRLDSGRLDAWSLDSWTLDNWTLGLWTVGHLDSGRLDDWTLGLWTLELWTLKTLDAWTLDDWTLGLCRGVSQNFHHNCRTLKFYWTFPVVANYHKFVKYTETTWFFVDKENRNLKSYSNY